MTEKPVSRSVLVLGGARSGKSTFAEKMVLASGLKPVYLATGQAYDSEMSDRIAHHQLRRGEEWLTIEAPLDLAGALQNHAGPDHFVLVDCLTLWLSNLMMAERDIARERVILLEALQAATGNIVLVSNEVGLGIVPDNRMAREFRDHAGFLHQAVAELVDEVYFVAAGLPLKMKGAA